MYRKLLVLFVFISFFRDLPAQTQSNFSGWNAYFLTYKTGKKWSIVFDGQLRSSDKWAELQTAIFRPGLQYQVRKNHFSTLGYGLIGHHRRISGVDGWAAEHRLWEQYIITHVLPMHKHPVGVQHRFRLEQRFIGKSALAGDHLVHNGYDFAHRLRYFTRVVIPLKKTNAFTKGYFASLQNEVFVNIGDASATNDKFFDQNRAYVSAGYRISPKFDIELGYMNQFIQGRNNNTSNNILQLAGYCRL